MSRSIIPRVILLAALSLALFSCARDRAVDPKSSGETVPDGAGTGNMAAVEEELKGSPEVRELLAVRDEIAGRALARHLTDEEVRDAALDAEKGNELLGLSGAEAGELQGRIDASLAQLYAKYPELEGLVAQAQPADGACDADGLAAAWARYSALAASAGRGGPDPATWAERAPAREPLRCRWVQLVAGFGMCAVKSGGSLLFYALCAYGVFCGSCSGGAADIICM
jgi:hypothetical protein